ncbi:MAG TPA: hypothetical protein PK011_02400 [Marinagarivorans sp.]|nr:hypothetical protein [Marinagarivorans sp.]
MNKLNLIIGGIFSLSLSSAHGEVLLYEQDFEHPVNFVNDGGDVNIFRTVNNLYANQPAGFEFAQTYTVETLLVGGSSAWTVAGNPGGGFKDPQGIAGKHVISMLSDRQDDWLALSFDVGAYKFLNFDLDISSIDLNNFGGPFYDGKAPKFQLSLYDNPSGAVGLGSGSFLSRAEASGTLADNRWTFNWSHAAVGLSTAGNTNGHVTLRVDLLEGGYGALDNFRIAASDIPAVPEPANWLMLVAGLGLTARLARRLS